MSDVQTPVSVPAIEGFESPQNIAGLRVAVARILDALLTGADTLERLAMRLGIDPQDKQALGDLAAIVRLPDVQNGILLARRDMAAYVVERFKQESLLYADVVKEIALDPKMSPKTRLAAAQDGLNRAGTAASQKVSIDTPGAYAARLKDLLEPEESVREDKRVD